MNKVENGIIAYTVSRAANNGANILIQNGEVVVRVPWYFSNNKIQNIVEEKAQLIAEKLREYEDKNIQKRAYIKNENIKLFGKELYLQVSYRNIDLPRLEVQDLIVKIDMPVKYKKMDNSDIVRVLIEKMYNRIAKEQIENIMEKVRIVTGIAPEDYEISRMENTLGKCINGDKIIINPDVVMQNKETIEYIILHEFCHLRYKNHTKSFYDMLQQYMPNYEKHSKLLKNYKY